jgi:hypothetical protein
MANTVISGEFVAKNEEIKIVQETHSGSEMSNSQMSTIAK